MALAVTKTDVKSPSWDTEKLPATCLVSVAANGWFDKNNENSEGQRSKATATTSVNLRFPVVH